MFVKKEWKDLPLETTPLDAQGLNDQEQRIADAINPVIENGGYTLSNSGNWKWKKYNDGTFEAEYKETKIISINTGVGSIFRSAGGLIGGEPTPFSMKTITSLLANCYGGNFVSLAPTNQEYPNTSRLPRYVITSPTSQTDVTIEVYYLLKGTY